MSRDQSEATTADTRGSQQASEESDETRGMLDSAGQWFAATALRTGLTIFGVVLLLFALGQAVGLPMLEMARQAITSNMGQWLIVAVFAILLIGAAQRISPSW